MRSWHWDLTRNEMRDVVGAFLTLGGFMAGHSLLETARDSLFLAKLPSTELPWVYLCIAALSLVLTRSHRRLAKLFAARNELSLWLSFAGAITLAFWVLVGFAGSWVFYLLYVWSGVLATLVGVRFWTLLGSIFSLTQAKRVFALIGTGSVSGAILGSFIAVILAARFPARHLLLAAGGLLLVASLAPRLMRFRAASGPAPQESGEEFQAVLRKVWAGPYLRRLGLLILLSTVTFTLVDYLFKSAADRYIPAIELDEFFSSVYLTLNLASLLIQVLVAPRLLKRFGVHSNQGVTPGLMFVACLGFWAGGGFAAALFLKAVDGSLRHSLHRTATELLFVPLPEGVRSQVKGMIDVVGQRGGQALASLLILLTLRLGGTEGWFLGLTLLVAAAWLFSVPGVRQHYLGLFREILTSEATQTRIDFPALDTASVDKLLHALNHSDDRKVMAALEILGRQGKQDAVPALILYHPSAPVVLQALEVVGDSPREDVPPVLHRLLGHEHAAVRAAALRVLCRRSGTDARSALQIALKDRSKSVRTTALVLSGVSGELQLAECQEEIRRLCGLDPVASSQAAARAIRERPSSQFSSLLIWLAQHQCRDLETTLEVIRAMKAVGALEFFDSLVPRLATRALREDVTSALLALRPSPLVRLEAYLTNLRAPHRIRCHIPPVIVKVEPFSGAAILVDHLQAESDGMVRYKILRALGALRAEGPKVDMDTEALKAALERTIEFGHAYSRWRKQLNRTVGAAPGADPRVHATLVNLLHHKQFHTLERAFRLLNLIYVNEDFRKIYDGLLSRDERASAGSRELLEYLVPKTMAASLVKLADESPTRGRMDLEGSLDYASVLGSVLDGDSEIVRCLAIRQIAALQPAGWRTTLRGRLRRASATEAEVLVKALGENESAVGGRGGR